MQGQRLSLTEALKLEHEIYLRLKQEIEDAFDAEARYRAWFYEEDCTDECRIRRSKNYLTAATNIQKKGPISKIGTNCNVIQVFCSSVFVPNNSFCLGNQIISISAIVRSSSPCSKLYNVLACSRFRV